MLPTDECHQLCRCKTSRNTPMQLILHDDLLLRTLGATELETSQQNRKHSQQWLSSDSPYWTVSLRTLHYSNCCFAGDHQYKHMKCSARQKTGIAKKIRIIFRHLFYDYWIISRIWLWWTGKNPSPLFCQLFSCWFLNIRNAVLYKNEIKARNFVLY